MQGVGDASGESEWSTDVKDSHFNALKSEGYNLCLKQIQVQYLSVSTHAQPIRVLVDFNLMMKKNDRCDYSTTTTTILDP